MNRLAYIGLDQITVKIWDADSGGKVSAAGIQHTAISGISQLCCSKDGNRLASSFGDFVYIWNINCDGVLDLVQTIQYSNQSLISSLALNYDGSRVVSADQRNGSLFQWDIESAELLWSHNSCDSHVIYTIDFSFDGALIASGGRKCQVYLCSGVTGEEKCVLTGHRDAIKSIKFSPDASRIASGSNDKTIRIWDIPSRSEVMLLEGHIHAVLSLSYSFDGTRLVSGSYDRTAMVWDVESGVCLLLFRNHTGVVRSVSFSSDGSRIVSGGSDKCVIIWDSASGCEIVRLEEDARPMSGICYLPTISDYLLK